MEAEEQGKVLFPFTTGETKYDFIHVDDLVKQISTVVGQDKINGIINCCSGEPVALKDKVEQFLEDNNYNIKLEYGAFPERPYDSKIIYGDSEKINKIMKNKVKKYKKF